MRKYGVHVETSDEIKRKIIERKAKRLGEGRPKAYFTDTPNRRKERKAKRLADAMRKRQRGCKQHRTGIKPKR